MLTVPEAVAGALLELERACAWREPGSGDG
jgi:hypothetical protein